MEPFIGEIRMFAGTFAPRGWAMCSGQMISISQNTALFSVLGNAYGGDGRSTFALPNLQGASPVGVGQGPGLQDVFSPGDRGGAAQVTLQSQQLPTHTHPVVAQGGAGDTRSPAGAIWAESRQGRATEKLYAAAPATKTMSPGLLAVAGGGQPHENMPPYLVLNFVIALMGIYPSRA